MSSIDRDTLLSVLPEPLRKDAHMLDLATTAADALVSAWGQTNLPKIYSDLDHVPEWLLDVLAKELDVNLYDRTYTVEVKRALIKDAMYTHRHLGTPSAIISAIQDIWAEVNLEEWFEYSGQPYHFRVTVTGGYTPASEALTRKIIDCTKNVRSQLDIIKYNAIDAEAIIVMGEAVCGMSVEFTCMNMEDE